MSGFVQESFFEACASSDWRTRLWAIESAHGDIPLVCQEALVGLLSDPQREVGLAAASALKRVKRERISSLITPHLRSGAESHKELALMALEGTTVLSAQKELLAVLVQDDELFRMLAARSLMGCRHRSVIEMLVSLLSHRHGAIARAASLALTGTSDNATIGILCNTLLLSPDPQQRAHAARSLNNIREQGAIEALGRALYDSDGEVRLRAIESLKPHRDVRHFQIVSQFLSDEKAALRKEAACFLKGIRDYPVPERILSQLQTERVDSVRIALFDALAQNSDQRTQSCLERGARDEPSPGARIACLNGLALPLSNSAITLLIHCLKLDERPEVRAVATEKLRLTFETSSHHALSHAACADPHPQVRANALRALRSKRCEWNDQLVRHILGTWSWWDENEAVREAALQYAEQDLHEQTTEALVHYLRKEPVPRLRKKALVILGTRPGKVVAGILLKALHDGDPEVRCAALHGLLRCNIPRLVDFLVHIIFRDEHGEVRAEAARLLKDYADESALRALVYALGDDVIMVRQAAAYALKGTNNSLALTGLLELVQEGNPRTCFLAGLALQGTSHRETVESLIELSDHSRPHVRGAARYALQDSPCLKARQKLYSTERAGSAATTR